MNYIPQAAMNLDASLGHFRFEETVADTMSVIGTVSFTELELSNEVTRLQAVYDSQLYARTRKAKYDLLNQDEMRYDDLVNNTTTWRDGIAAIKAAHPKP